MTSDYAIVFSGGGALGAWEVGCYQAILSRHANKPPRIVTGASAGAINAAGICAGLPPGELARHWQSLSPQTVYTPRLDANAGQIIGRALIGQSVARQLQDLADKYDSIYSTTPLEATFRRIFKPIMATFSDSSIDCVFSLTDLNKSRPTFFYRGRKPLSDSTADWVEMRSLDFLIQGLMGTTALPLLFPPFMGNLFDGGVLMNQPISPAIKLGAKIIYIIIPNSEGWRRTNSLLSIAEALFATWIEASLLSQIEIIKVTNELISAKVSEQGIAVCIIRPDSDLSAEYNINLLSFGKAVPELIANGERSANLRLNRFSINEAKSWY
jgi:NTE family protein